MQSHQLVLLIVRHQMVNACIGFLFLNFFFIHFTFTGKFQMNPYFVMKRKIASCQAFKYLILRQALYGSVLRAFLWKQLFLRPCHFKLIFLYSYLSKVYFLFVLILCIRILTWKKGNMYHFDLNMFSFIHCS